MDQFHAPMDGQWVIGSTRYRRYRILYTDSSSKHRIINTRMFTEPGRCNRAEPYSVKLFNRQMQYLLNAKQNVKIIVDIVIRRYIVASVDHAGMLRH